MQTFILFLTVPLVVFATAFIVGQIADENDLDAAQPVVAVIADSETTQALVAVRDRLAQGTPERSLPLLKATRQLGIDNSRHPPHDEYLPCG